MQSRDGADSTNRIPVKSSDTSLLNNKESNKQGESDSVLNSGTVALPAER